VTFSCNQDGGEYEIYQFSFKEHSFYVAPCILETIYYAPMNPLLYCNSLKSLH